MAFLEVYNISKFYTLPDASFLKVLEDVSFKLEKGKLISIIGPSGSGKSSLLQLIGLMDVVSAGEIFLEQQLVSSLPKDKKAIIRSKKIGFIFQTPMLINDLTVAQNIILPQKVLNDADTAIQIDELINSVGLLPKKNYFPSFLSSGEAQRVSIARSIVNNPLMILADEPISHLDKANKVMILELLKSISIKTGVAIVLASHDDIVLSFSDSVYKLDNGKLLVE